MSNWYRWDRLFWFHVETYCTEQEGGQKESRAARILLSIGLDRRWDVTGKRLCHAGSKPEI